MSLILVLFSLHSVWQEENQIHWLWKAAPVFLHGWVSLKPLSLPSHQVKPDSFTVALSQTSPCLLMFLWLGRAACLISGFLGQNSEKENGKANRYFLCASHEMLQERWKSGCQSRDFASGTLILERLNIFQEEKNSGICIGKKKR